MRLWVIGGLLVGLVLAGGCERTETDRSLVITPLDARVAWEEAITFVASMPAGTDTDREILYPLEWSISDPSLGSLQRAGGDAVVYVAGRRSGSNSIMVQDQSGAKGVASIVQSAPAASADGG